MPKPQRSKKRLKRFNLRVNLLNPELFKFTALAIVSIFLLVWQIGFLTINKINNTELITKNKLITSGPWWKSIIHIYGPYYSLLHATYALNHTLLGFRLASILCGFISALLVYYALNQYHGHKISILASSLYITNFGFLVVSRQASPIASQLLLLIALTCLTLLLNKKPNLISLAITVITLSGLLYIPGAIWLIITTTIISYRSLKKAINDTGHLINMLLILLGLLIITPLIYSLVRYYSINRLIYYLGYNLHGKLTALKTFALNLAYTPFSLFIHSFNSQGTITLGHLPIIPIAESLIIIVGFYYYFKHLNNYRWRSLLIIIAVSWLLTGFGVISYYSLLPLMTIVAGTGLAYLLKEWYGVFPFNKIARISGLILMSAVIIYTGFYSAHSYFIAWGRDPQILNQYDKSLKS